MQNKYSEGEGQIKGGWEGEEEAEKGEKLRDFHGRERINNEEIQCTCKSFWGPLLLKNMKPPTRTNFFEH